MESDARFKELVKKYYSELGVKEWKRLVRDPYHRLEFDTTMYFLRKYLPRKGLVLDAGGGLEDILLSLLKWVIMLSYLI